MKISNPVLVVIDVQNGFINDHSRAAVPGIAALIMQCQERGIPTILTKFINAENSPFERFMGWLDVRETPEIDLYEMIHAPAGIVLEKHYYTALTDEFLRLSNANEWQTIIICGMSTESCVLKTAVDAFEKGFRPLVIIDACASNLGPDVHLKGLDILKVLIGKSQLITFEQFLEKLGT